MRPPPVRPPLGVMEGPCWHWGARGARASAVGDTEVRYARSPRRAASGFVPAEAAVHPLLTLCARAQPGGLGRRSPAVGSGTLCPRRPPAVPGRSAQCAARPLGTRLVRSSVLSWVMGRLGCPGPQGARLARSPRSAASKCLIHACLLPRSRVAFRSIFIASGLLPKFSISFLNFPNVSVTITSRSAPDAPASVSRRGSVSVVCFSLGFHSGLALSRLRDSCDWGGRPPGGWP